MSTRPRRRQTSLADAEAPGSPQVTGMYQRRPTTSSAAPMQDDDKKERGREKEGRGETFSAVFRSRGTVLVTLMVVQSLSGMILGSFERLIQDHVVITLFLTMLVGAGGNAGNQSTVNVIRGLATGEINAKTRWAILWREAQLGLSLGLLLSGVAFLRVVLWKGDFASALAIGVASLVIVSISAATGAAMPLLFVEIGIDAAHAGPAIQVAMDIIGVTCTCIICAAIFKMFGPEEG